MAVFDAIDLACSLVHAATGLGDALHALDYMDAFGIVLKRDFEGLFDLLALLLDGGKVSGLLELLGNSELERGKRERDDGVLNSPGVREACDEICDRISDHITKMTS